MRLPEKQRQELCATVPSSNAVSPNEADSEVPLLGVVCAGGV